MTESKLSSLLPNVLTVAENIPGCEMSTTRACSSNGMSRNGGSHLSIALPADVPAIRPNTADEVRPLPAG
jgi:hypothetical protein